MYLRVGGVKPSFYFTLYSTSCVQVFPVLIGVLFIFVWFIDDSLELPYCIVSSGYLTRHLSILFLINSTKHIVPFYFGSICIVTGYNIKNFQNPMPL